MLLSALLISRPDRPAVAPELVHKAAAAVDASKVRTLWPDAAVEFELPAGADADAARASLLAAREGAPVDVAVLPAADRRKKILIADMDSTMIDQECIDELADEIGFGAKVAAITERAMRGEIAFEPALRERVALLKGLETGVIERVIETRLTLASGAKALVATMRANGAHAALVSGGFDAFTSRIAAMLGFDESRANRLREQAGRLTGQVEEPILGRAAKAETLLSVSSRLGLSPHDAIAVGDGANDLDMLKLAGIGVALHAKPAVAEAAHVRIDHGDLTALLFLQGYEQAEIVTP